MVVHPTTGHRGTGPPNRADRRRAWPKRRVWLDRIAAETRLTAGAKTWLLLLARRSDDNGKPVWGNQVRMAEQIGRCDRSVRRYRAEAEQLGYVDCYRSKPLRDPHTGRWGRVRSNAYYLDSPAGRRPQSRHRGVDSGRQRLSSLGPTRHGGVPPTLRTVTPDHHPSGWRKLRPHPPWTVNRRQRHPKQLLNLPRFCCHS
jgi:hypothetical protein